MWAVQFVVTISRIPVDMDTSVFLSFVCSVFCGFPIIPVRGLTGRTFFSYLIFNHSAAQARWHLAPRMAQRWYVHAALAVPAGVQLASFESDSSFLTAGSAGSGLHSRGRDIREAGNGFQWLYVLNRHWSTFVLASSKWEQQCVLY